MKQTAQHNHPSDRTADAGMVAEQDRAVDHAASVALSNRVIAEIATIDTMIGQLRLQHGSEAEEAIGHLEVTRSLLFTSLRDVQHAKHPRDLRYAASCIDVAIRHSIDTRAAAPVHQETPAMAVKKRVQAAAVPVAGMVALKFVGKPLGLLDYRQALGMLQERGQALLQGFAASIEAHADAASQHMVDIVQSQQAQARLLEHAREAYIRDQPVEAAARISEAATLGLRDAEHVRGIHADEATAALLDQARENATQAARHAADQIQVEARRDCTQQGKKAEELEACTQAGSALRIESVRVRMMHIQLQVQTPQDEAEERANRIIGSIAPQGGPSLLLGQARAEQQARDAAMQFRLTVAEVNMRQVQFAPAETPPHHAVPVEMPVAQAF